ncbi:MAG: Crp/Fnr family transcriptional regulator [Acidobacteriota bacterium]|nr:Crp/Fnr family transcriptional regulator [Acidobacteriota bacterium]
MVTANQFCAEDHRTCQTLTEMTLHHLPGTKNLGRLRNYCKGSDIWRPEDQSDRVYFVQRGEVAILFGDAQGHEVILRKVGAGQLLGELCFCVPEHSLRETFARANLETQALEVKYSEFVNHLQDDNLALQSLLITFCTRLAEAERRAEILMYRGADERLSRLLLQLAEMRGHPHKASPGPVMLHISHDELAQTAAMSRAHVTVTMGRLRELGLVSYGRNKPLIVNMPHLAAYIHRR